MPKIIDLTGQRFGKLVVIEQAGKIGNHIAWICKCDCGNITKAISGNNLKKGHVKSCGCLYRKYDVIDKVEMQAETCAKPYSKRLYSIWASMKSRCYNEKCTNYEHYGARGITVCDEWLHDFQSFYDWAMANGYADNLSIDRENVNGDYCPENCRWATLKEQANNTRKNIVITHNGRTQTLSMWAEELGIDYHKLLMRIKRGWSPEKAFCKK